MGTTRDFPVGLSAGMPAPATQAALSRAVPLLIITAWRELAADQVDSGDYLAHLTPQSALAYPYGGDPDSAAVINTAISAYWLEHGRAGFHLPGRWGSGRGRWKVSAKGTLYARVPFRISTPGAPGGGMSTSRRRGIMPSSVHTMTAGMDHGDRLVGFGGAFKQSKSYLYFAQVYEGFPTELIDAVRKDNPDSGGYTWKASQYEGMFQAGLRSTPGGGTQSQYMTIRTITPNSPGWYIPPTPAHHYAERAIDAAAPQIAAVLDRAVAADIELAVLQSMRGVG